MEVSRASVGQYILYITHESICILGVIDPDSGIIIIITFYKVILLIRYAHQSSRFVHYFADPAEPADKEGGMERDNS